MLKLSKGGSLMTFASDNKCCIRSCGNTKKENSKLPFYTFPSSPELCKEWLQKIHLDDSETNGQLDKLHLTHVVCSKHFSLVREGMRLSVDDDNADNIENAVNNENAHNNVNANNNSTSSVISKVSTGVSVCTQTFHDDWLSSLKVKYGAGILCGKNVQCRVCASVCVQALNIYNKCTEHLNLENLINKLLPIQVKPTDKKPLNICVHCVYKLKQFTDLINCSSNNDKDFDLSNKINESKKNISDEKKSNNKEIIVITLDSDNEDNNINTSIDPNEKLKTNDNLNKSKCNKNNSNPHDFIKKERRIHKIKILLSPKINNAIENLSLTKDHNNGPSVDKSNANKVIEVEFTSHYIICHGREWIHKIIIDNNQLKYSQNTIKNILETIQSTMKNLCEKKNSKVVPLVVNPSQLDRVMISQKQQQMQTEFVIIDGQKHLDDKTHKQSIETALKTCFVCTVCGLNLDSKQSCTKHSKKCHPKPCRFCGEIVMPREKLRLHENEHRKPSEDGYICHLCGHKFKTFKGLNCHLKKHQNHERFSCVPCDIEFSNGYSLKKHLRQKHKETVDEHNSGNIQTKRQKCTICEHWLSSKLALRVHMKTHLPLEERMKICPECNKVFINARRFKLHVETHGPCPIKCTICSRTFPTQEHFDNHMHHHKIIEPVYCDICQRNFKTRTTLRNHIARVHEGVQYVQKTFSCLFCKIVFSNKEELKTHIQTHTFEEKAQAFTGDEYGKFQCDDCNKFFLFKSRLSIHKIYHHSKPCLQCGKHTIGNLANHYCKPKGSNALQYCCEHCTKRFSSKQRLNLHERTHGLDYRFQCSVCSKLFKQKTALNTHMNLHSNIQQYVCNMCGKICKLASRLKSHMKTCGKNVNNKINILDPYNLHNYAITLPSTEPHIDLSLNVPITIPIDEQGYFICDASQDIHISHVVDISEQQLQDVDIIELQNSYVE